LRNIIVNVKLSLGSPSRPDDDNDNADLVVIGGGTNTSPTLPVKSTL
jgi:hypothetical protein